MNIASLCIATLLCTTALTSQAQKDTLIIPDNINLPKDAIVKKQLLASLNAFLAHTDKPDGTNPFVVYSSQLETAPLLDEMKSLKASSKYKDDNFYKAYLNNAAQLNDSTFLVQLSYIGLNEGTPLLRAVFTLFAKKKDTQFYFYSPLKQNTITWKSEKINSTNVYYKNTLNTQKAKAYFKMVAEYDKKLSAPKQQTDFYCADNFHEVLQLIGVDYKSDYNGYARNTLTAKENGQHINVNGTLTSDFTKFDPHDLWHDRLHKVLSTSVINRPVDEGTAYLYGGSWGLSWKEILDKFKAYAHTNNGADWLALYNESENFDKKGKYPLNVDFVINALLVQKIEREKGFSSVIDLLSCGNKVKGNENYFKALEQITGINKASFNANVWALIDAD